MFGMLESLTKSVINVVTTPVAVVADVVTLGGTLTDRRESYTEESLRKAKENFDDAVDPKGNK
jgi:hypothetical protein